MNIAMLAKATEDLRHKINEENRATIEDTHKMRDIVAAVRNGCIDRLVEMQTLINKELEALDNFLVQSAAERQNSLDEALGPQDDTQGTV